MRNKKLVKIIAAVLICYFLFQVILYAFIHSRQDDSSEGSRQVESHEEDEKRISSFRNVFDFVTECHNHGIPLILLDFTVLHSVITLQSSATKECLFFCNLNGSTVFGVLSQLWTHDKSFLDDLKDNGFRSHYVMERDTSALEYLSLSENVYTHYMIERYGHIIHLVILYSRPDGYWWLGHVRQNIITYDESEALDNHLSVELNDSFTKEGAYDIAELIKVTMDGIKLRAPRYPKVFLDQISQSAFLRCNQSRAKLFHGLYGGPGDGSETFREAAKETLYLVKKTLDILGVRFWLSSGTCLGWFRQCDTISYSGDVDIGIWIKDYSRQLIPAMQQAGFVLKHLFGKESDSFELSFYNGDMKLDIFFFYEEDDHMWNGGTQVKTGNKYKYIFPKFSLCWTEFLEMKLRVPCNTQAYIEANYGEKWFEPVKMWDWKSSPPNVRPNGRWPEEEWDKVILSFG